jgi:glycosyltransferase involved in cell wall biosynthesis
MLTFTVVLCTRNRATLLRDALTSLGKLDYPPRDLELVVVDNGSTDATPQVIESFAGQAPFEVRYVFEEKPGLSAARNAAIAAARGKYLFFTDDDQLVDPAVLREHERVIEQYGVGVVQGNIELEFTEPRPPWLKGDLATMLGKTRDVPEGPAKIDLYGGNMVFRRDVFDRIAAFREDLGKGAAGYSEDIEITRRLWQAGETIAYAPTARIYHVIGPDRAHPGFFRRNAFEKGLSDGVLFRGGVTGIVRSLGAVLGSASGAAAFALVGARHRSLVQQTRVMNQVGRLVGYVRRLQAPQ